MRERYEQANPALASHPRLCLCSPSASAPSPWPSSRIRHQIRHWTCASFLKGPALALVCSQGSNQESLASFQSTAQLGPASLVLLPSVSRVPPPSASPFSRAFPTQPHPCWTGRCSCSCRSCCCLAWTARPDVQHETPAVSPWLAAVTFQRDASRRPLDATGKMGSCRLSPTSLAGWREEMRHLALPQLELWVHPMAQDDGHAFFQHVTAASPGRLPGMAGSAGFLRALEGPAAAFPLAARRHLTLGLQLLVLLPWLVPLQTMKVSPPAIESIVEHHQLLLALTSLPSR
mmetsp:Transcript_36603/g.84163  ORF Transcript_36603/g.84163 Transcript_36603/m.84163 type:complete len:289 (-) Transcript_36603:2411-3277(-)